MATWLNIFMFLGIKKYVTIALGSLALVMGLINAKDFFFFKKGISLVIPEGSKPGLYERARKILRQGDAWLGIAGTAALAFFVNLVELGCTIGLPAIYTRGPLAAAHLHLEQIPLHSLLATSAT